MEVIVIVISSDPSWKDGNAWFKTTPLKPFLVNNVKDIVVFKVLNLFNSDSSSQIIFLQNAQMIIINLPNWFLIHTWLENVFKGTIVHRALPSLHGGSPKVTLTVLLNINWHVINREGVLYLRNKVPPLSSSSLAVIHRDLNAGFHQSWIPFRSISFRMMIYKSRVNHIRWNFRNEYDCTEFVRSFSMILWICKPLPFFAKPLN